MKTNTFEEKLENVLSGVYARAADNNGNSSYLQEGYADYNIDEAKSAIIDLVLNDVINAEIDNWANGAGEKEKFIRQMQINQLRETQRAIITNEGEQS